MMFIAKKLEKTMTPSGPGKVVDIKKYLAQTKDNPKIHKNEVDREAFGKKIIVCLSTRLVVDDRDSWWLTWISTG